MARALILRAMLAGAIGGLVAFVFARIFAEPLIQQAIDYESGRDEAQAALDAAAGQAAEAEGPELFSRAVQGNVGIGAGIVLFGVALGCLFGVAFCLAYGRYGAVTARKLAVRLGVAGFLAIYLVPFVKYPANPPAIGNGDTIAQRGSLYLGMVVASVVFGLLAVRLGRALQPRVGTTAATWYAAIAFVVVIGIVMALLPPLGSLAANAGATGPELSETPQPLLDPAGKIVYPGFDADLLYWFRLYSVTAQVLLWGVLVAVFGPLAERVLGSSSAAQRDELAATG
ncbi:CbtA family protein [Pseudonocardia phyllosphaerae]|uniref:CbtA family protein n=1 Tax=Pseudonocardia phyllosphaerae TaxID=3390502 RepID=UPI00397D5442